MPEKAILELRKIQKILPGGFYLKDIDFDLYPGEIHVVMGENGSGKSCLMQIISGLLKPDNGVMRVLGENVNFSGADDAANKSVLYIQQNANILKHLTIPENIFYHQMPYSNKFFKIIDRNLLNRKCADIIRDLDLPFSLEDQVSRLGLAQRQILGFSRAYVSNAKVVILDEPSAALTEHDQKILHTIVDSIKARGGGIIYISHNLDEIRQFGDRVSILSKGELAGTLDLKSHSDDDIIRLMSGAAVKNRYPRLWVSPGKELLRVENLSMEPVLNDISFNLRRGEVVGLTGLAGSGRTCLAHSLFGANRLDSGTIYLGGRKAGISSPVDAIGNGLALIPEDRISDSLVSCLDVADNVSLSSLNRFSRFASIDTTFLNQVVMDYIQKFNMETLDYDRNIGDYGLGSQQKAVFAKWIMKRSKIFILDEPTRSLDIPTRIDIYNSMNDLVSKGAGVLFISSDIEEILGMCDRVLVLHNGEIVCDLNRHQATKELILAYATGEASHRRSADDLNEDFRAVQP